MLATGIIPRQSMLAKQARSDLCAVRPLACSMHVKAGTEWHPQAHWVVHSVS